MNKPDTTTDEIAVKDATVSDSKKTIKMVMVTLQDCADAAFDAWLEHQSDHVRSQPEIDQLGAWEVAIRDEINAR